MLTLTSLLPPFLVTVTPEEPLVILTLLPSPIPVTVKAEKTVTYSSSMFSTT